MSIPTINGPELGALMMRGVFSPMTPKQKVRLKFPKAHAYLHGSSHYVTQSKESGVVLATAPNRKAAWASAAQRVSGTNPA